MRPPRFPSLAALLLALAFAGTLAAQVAPPPFACNATANAVSVRAEGTAEPVADVVVTCTGGFSFPSDSNISPQDIKLTFNGNVTSRILGANGASEGFLLMDEPAPGFQFPCDSRTGICVAFGNRLGTGYYGNGPQTLTNPNNRNIFQGLVNAATVFTTGTPQTITWPSIPVDPPGAGTRIYRFSNLRMDPSSVKGNNLIVSAIDFLSLNGPTPTITGLPLVVGTARTSLATSVLDGADTAAVPAGVNVPVAPSGAPTTRLATLRFAAVGGTDKARTIAAFTNVDTSPPPVDQNVPGFVSASESGFYSGSFGTFVPGDNLALAGLADSGTRYMAVFTNIPAGFTISVDIYNSTASGGPTARLINADPNGAGPFAANGSGSIATLPVTNGTATAVWEVLRNSGGPDTFDLGVYLSYTAGLPFGQPPVNVQMRYAPLTASNAIPSFSAITGTQTIFNFVQPPALIVTPASLAFTATAGGSNPTSQPLAIGSSNTFSLGFNLGTAGTLPVSFQSTSGTTPASVGVTINIQGLAPGVYNDTILAVASNGTPTVNVPISLTLNPPPTTCNASAKAVPVRAEGTAERVADVVLTCTGGFPFLAAGPLISPQDIKLTFNGNVTSRILGTNGASEAFLLMDEPQPGFQFPCDSKTGICTGIGNGAGGGPGYYGNGPQSLRVPNNRNIYQGLVNAGTVFTTGTPQTITWPSVPVDFPAAGTRIYRFSNLRMDPSSVKGSNLIVSTINFLSLNGPTPAITGLPLVVGVAQSSLATSVRDSANVAAVPAGVTIPVTPNGGQTNRLATLRFASTAGAGKARTIAPFTKPMWTHHRRRWIRMSRGSFRRRNPVSTTEASARSYPETTWHSPDWPTRELAIRRFSAIFLRESRST
jgi:hypothetical protein